MAMHVSFRDLVTWVHHLYVTYRQVGAILPVHLHGFRWWSLLVLHGLDTRTACVQHSLDFLGQIRWVELPRAQVRPIRYT